MATKSKIHIKPSKRGTLRKAMGAKEGEKLSVSAMKKKMKNASPAMRKKLNFAINARKWKHEDGGLLSTDNLYNSFAEMNNLPTRGLSESGLAPTNNPGGGGGGLNMSFDPISLGLSALTAIGGSLGANMAAEKTEMYEDASENMRTVDVNKVVKGSGVQAFLQNPLSLGIGGRKRARLEAEEFNENIRKQQFSKDVNSRFSAISQAPTYTPVARQGGFIAYKGQTHDGPDGGILVDQFGNPTSISSGESIASVEGGGKNKKGEVSHYDPETGSTYIYSDALKFAKPANALLNKYKLNKPNSLQYQQYKNDLLTKTMVDKKFEELRTAQEFAKETNLSTEDSLNMFRNGGELTRFKAKKMLKDGTAHGKKLTAKQKRYFGWVASGMKEDGGPLSKRTILMPKENLEYDRDLRMNPDWMGSLQQAQDLDSMYSIPVGTWKGNPLSLKDFTKMPEYVTSYYRPDYAIEFNKNRLGLPNTFQDINLKNTKPTETVSRYQPASTVVPANQVAYYKKGGKVLKSVPRYDMTFEEEIADPFGLALVPGYTTMEQGKKDNNMMEGVYNSASSPFMLGEAQVSAIPSAKKQFLEKFAENKARVKKFMNVKYADPNKVSQDKLRYPQDSYSGNRNLSTSPKYNTVSKYEVPNLEINPTQIPGVTFSSAPKLNMPSGFANVSGLYDRKTPNAGPGYYNKGFTRPYNFGNMEPASRTQSRVERGLGQLPYPVEAYRASDDLMQMPEYGSLVSEQGVANMNLPTTPVTVEQGINPLQEESYGANWLNPVGHILSGLGSIADYAAMRKARPENVNLGRVGAERISLAKQRLANERQAASARAMATSAARSSGMNAGVALSNATSANTGVNRLLGEQNAELLEREETANAQMRQQANMVNAELAAQEGLFNTQQQNAYKMMMASRNPLSNIARTTASYFADNAAYQQDYDTLQMLAPNAELYTEPNKKGRKNPFKKPKVRLR